MGVAAISRHAQASVSGRSSPDLRLPINNRVEPLGDGVVDNRLQLVGLLAEVFDGEHVREEAFDDTVGLERASRPHDPSSVSWTPLYFSCSASPRSSSFPIISLALAGLTPRASATDPVEAGPSSCFCTTYIVLRYWSAVFTASLRRRSSPVRSPVHRRSMTAVTSLTPRPRPRGSRAARREVPRGRS